MSAGTLMIAFAVLFFAVLLIFAFRIKCEYIFGLHIAGRVVLDSIYVLSYGEVAAGVTVMQLYSVAWIGFFFVYIWYMRGGKLIYPRFTWAIVLLIFSCGISALINGKPYEFVHSSLKWFYLYTLVLFCVNTLDRTTVTKFCWVVLVPGIYLFLNQIGVGLVSGPKQSHGLINYIGSYYHEAGFSSLVLLMLAITIALRVVSESRFLNKILLLVIVFEIASLIVAGYRTSILAGATLLASYIYFLSLRNPMYNATYMFVALCGVLGLSWLALYGYLDLFKDIGLFLSNPGRYLDFSSGNGGDKELLTGRIYILNRIMYTYLNASALQQIGGLGAGISQEVIGAYAHNELISALAEFGIIGVMVFVYFHYKIIRTCFIAKKRDRKIAYLSLSVILSIMVLSLATMPYHDLRALIYLGVLYSFAEYYSRLKLVKNV